MGFSPRWRSAKLSSLNDSLRGRKTCFPLDERPTPAHGESGAFRSQENGSIDPPPFNRRREKCDSYRRSTRLPVLSALAGIRRRSPAIQEYLLLLAVSQASPISEVGVRRIARESRWDRQRAVFESVLVRKGCLRPPSVCALVCQLTVLDALGVRR